MDERPLSLGVGICALDEERTLPRLLARLLQVRDGADRADRVVVADGGSRDATAELARNAGAEVVSSPLGRGPQLATAGAELLAGEPACELLLFLHADCVPVHGALASVRRAFADPDVRAVGLRQQVEAEGRFFRLVERGANARARRGMVYGDSGLALRAALYRELGGFRPLPLFEDVDLSKRVRRLTRVRLVEDATLAVSPRRWQREGALRCTLRNWMLRALYEVGVPPGRLARLYSRESARPAEEPRSGP